MSLLKKILWVIPIAFIILHVIPRHCPVHTTLSEIPGYNLFVIEIRDTKPYKALINGVKQIVDEAKNYEGKRYDNLRAPLIVEVAKSYIGVKYQFGGDDRSGVDCSGLVYCVCREDVNWPTLHHFPFKIFAMLFQRNALREMSSDHLHTLPLMWVWLQDLPMQPTR